MSNRVNISDLRFVSQNNLFPRDLECKRNIVKRFIKIAAADVHLFTITVEWMGKHSTNLGSKQRLIDELDSQISFEKQVVDLGENEYDKNIVLEMLSELQMILKQFILMKRRHYRLVRAYFLEAITLKYISVKHNVRKRNLFHEPTIFAKRRPLIPASHSATHKYRPSYINVDFAFKTSNVTPGLFLYECKASLAEFLKSIDETTERAKSALHKIDYILAVRNAFSSKIFNSNQYIFEANMTTYVDSPDYNNKNYLGFPKIIKPINVSLMKNILFR